LFEVRAVGEALGLLAQITHRDVGHVQRGICALVELGHIGARLEPHDEVRCPLNLGVVHEEQSRRVESRLIRLKHVVHHRVADTDDRRRLAGARVVRCQPVEGVAVEGRVDRHLLPDAQVQLLGGCAIDDDLVDPTRAGHSPGADQRACDGLVELRVTRREGPDLQTDQADLGELELAGGDHLGKTKDGGVVGVVLSDLGAEHHRVRRGRGRAPSPVCRRRAPGAGDGGQRESTREARDDAQRHQRFPPPSQLRPCPHANGGPGRAPLCHTSPVSAIGLPRRTRRAR